ncbi:MAG: hypothetical protein R2695_16675 [Acidimicrobiales bacterium]
MPHHDGYVGSTIWGAASDRLDDVTVVVDEADVTIKIRPDPN